jgi:phosphatidylglycerol:prolipoprotein diacylglycerol transferase
MTVLAAHTLAAWLHTIDPFLIRFTDSFGLRWYGMSYLAGFLVAYLLLRWLSSTSEKPGFTPLPRHRVGDAMVWLVGGVLVGGRLGYVLFYQPSLIWTFFDTAPWWGVLAINQGGMASHGGILGVILAAWRISRGFREPDGRIIGRMPTNHAMDLVAMLAPPGLFFGRLANFINGELLGRIVTPPGKEGPWWSVQYPQELQGWVAPGMRDLQSHTPDLTDEQQRALWSLASKLRIGDEPWTAAINRLIAGAADHAEGLKPLLASRHPSQLYQAAAEGLVLGAVVWIAAMRPRKPGIIGSWFLITYGVLRIATELVRLPDPGIERFIGLSRGQWLSVAMAGVGVAALFWSAMRTSDPMGGWLRPTTGRAGSEKNERR